MVKLDNILMYEFKTSGYKIMKTLKEFSTEYKKMRKDYIVERLDVEQPLDELIIYLRKLRNKYDIEYDGLHIEVDTEHYSNDYAITEIHLKGNRDETDKEFQDRIERDYRHYQKQIDEERRQLKYLQEKFKE